MENNSVHLSNLTNNISVIDLGLHGTSGLPLDKSTIVNHVIPDCPILGAVCSGSRQSFWNEYNKCNTLYCLIKIRNK